MKNGKVLIAVLAVVVIICGGFLAANKFNAEYEALNDYDQKIFAELNAVLTEERTNGPLWAGYTLGDKTLLLISKDTKVAYLVNAENAPSPIVGTAISMPSDIAVGSVYRLSPLTLSVRRLVTEGNFNTIEKAYDFWGQEVYFLRYSHEELDAPYSSRHFITLLTHEAFHYYMQNSWETDVGGDRSSQELVETLTEEDIDLMEESFEVLTEIQTEMLKDEPDKESLMQLAREYVIATDKRIASNPVFTGVEHSRETAEGTAQYICILSSRLAGYDYGPMYFDNRQNVPFNEIAPLYRESIKEGADTSRLWFDIPYSTGAQLCLLMDALDAPQWQEKLNAQTLDEPVTLYEVFREFITENS